MTVSLSIVVPCYNAEDTVDLTIRSVCQQVLRDIEIVAVDDCSTDSTSELLHEWERRDSRIRVVRNERNLGLGTARNVAAPLCRGEWIAFIDADDWVSRTFYANLVHQGAACDADLVRCDHTVVRGLDRKITHAPEERRGVCLDPRECILPVDAPSMVDYPYAWAGVYRRAFYMNSGMAFSALQTAEDRLFAWRILLESRRLLVSNEHGYMYRRDPRPTALTQTGDRRQLDIFKALEEVLNYLRENQLPHEFRLKAYRQCLAVTVSHFDRRRRLSAETWYEYTARAQRFLGDMDPSLLRSALHEFGERRTEVIQALAAGRATLA